MHSFAVKVGNKGYHVCRITSWKNMRITQQHNYKLQFLAGRFHPYQKNEKQ